MKAASINLLAAALTLLCLVHPLYSDPQRSHWPNYEGYKPEDHRTASLHRAQGHPGQVTRDATEINRFHRTSGPARYSEEIVNTLSPNVEGLRRFDDFPSSSREEYGQDRRNFEEGSLNEEGVQEKMRILDELLSEDPKILDTNGIEDRIIPEESRRVVRQVRKQKPGFFWTLARITFETINDTRSAIKQISDIVNNNIAPDSATQSTMMSGSLTASGSSSTTSNTTTVNATETSTSSPTTTTRAPFVLTRSGLQSLIRRNVLGLVRLFNIEWSDALNQSDITVREFQKDLGNQVGVYLRDNPNAY